MKWKTLSYTALWGLSAVNPTPAPQIWVKVGIHQDHTASQSWWDQWRSDLQPPILLTTLSLPALCTPHELLWEQQTNVQLNVTISGTLNSYSPHPPKFKGNACCGVGVRVVDGVGGSFSHPRKNSLLPLLAILCCWSVELLCWHPYLEKPEDNHLILFHKNLCLIFVL